MRTLEHFRMVNFNLDFNIRIQVLFIPSFFRNIGALKFHYKLIRDYKLVKNN